MKLLNQTNRIYLYSTGATMLVMLISIFFILKTVIKEELDEQLTQKATVAVEILESGTLPNDPFTIIETVGPHYQSPDIFTDTLIYNSSEGETELFRKLVTTTTIDQNKYRITLLSSELEWQDLIMVLTIIFIVAVLLSILGSFRLNKYLSSKIWEPFFYNLNLLKKFSVKQPADLEFSTSRIDEFQQLKETIEKLTARVSKDYRLLKEFTENASHEFQTPVSIIITKLDSLMQQEQLSKHDAEKLNSIRHAANRISRLTKDTLLLTKIESRQFSVESNINLAAVLSQQVGLHHEIFQTKHLNIQISIPESFSINANPTLLEKMLSNLLSNAFKHNVDHGWIKINLNSKKLIVENSGPDPGIPVNELFDRYKKGFQSSSSFGLGLAIIQEIAVFHRWLVDYSYDNSRHLITVHFNI